MKRILITIGLILLLCALILGGCSQGATTSSPAATAPAATASSSSPSPKPAATTAPPVSPTAPSSKPAPSSPAAGTPKYGGTLKLAWDASPAGSVGWPAVLTGDAGFGSQLIFEPLLRGDAKGGLFPCLAESYKTADDKLSITFILRKGVKFHDGTDFNAKAAKWNLDQMIAAKAQPFWNSVDAVDDYTVRVNLNRWTNFVINSFADTNPSWMVSPTAYDKNGDTWTKNNPVGTGPFKFVSFTRDGDYKVVRNPDYWQKGLPYLDGIQIQYITDATTRKMAGLSGSIDVMTIAPGQLSVDMANAGFTIKTKMETVNILMGDSANADSPWANQKVREAAEYALDREGLAKTFGYGYWQAPYQIPSRTTGIYNPNFSLGRKFDPAKAKQLLTEAGYPNGFKTTLAVGPTTGYNKDVTVALQSFWAAIGIQADLQYPDLGAWNANFLVGPPKNTVIYQLALGRANYCGTLNDWSTASVNYKNWARSPALSDLIKKALDSNPADPALMQAATDQISREAALIPVNETGKNLAVQPYVMGGSWFERSLSPWFASEAVWLNK
jgi:peptide/nickel transport system substrate-binding protein